MTVIASATPPETGIRQDRSFCLLVTIKMIATSKPKQVQIKPPREPVRSTAKKHASAAADRVTTLNARCSFDRVSSNCRSDENRKDCREKKAKQNHRIAPAPMNVAAVL